MNPRVKIQTPIHSWLSLSSGNSLPMDHEKFERRMRLYSHETWRHRAKSGDPLSLSIRPRPRHGARYTGAWQARYCAWHPHDTSHANWSFWPMPPHTLPVKEKRNFSAPSKFMKHQSEFETYARHLFLSTYLIFSKVESSLFSISLSHHITASPPMLHVTPTSPDMMPPSPPPDLTHAASGSVFSRSTLDTWHRGLRDNQSLETYLEQKEKKC